VDREVYALTENELPGARFYPFAEVWDKGLPLSGKQTWISTRFHFHMVAAAAGAGGVAIPISPDSIFRVCSRRPALIHRRRKFQANVSA
jgi:hypothetical protein